MNGKLTALLALGAFVVVSAHVFAESHEDIGGSIPPIMVAHLEDLEHDGDKAHLKSIATKAMVAALQREIVSDPALVRKLKARGIPIRRIVARQRAANGNAVFYIR